MVCFDSLYTDAILLQDIPNECTQETSVLPERHDVVGLETGYSVEFCELLGNTIAVATVPASALRTPTATDRPAVRSARASI